MKVCPDCQNEYADSVDFCPTDGMKLRSKRTGEISDPLIGTVLDGRWIIEEKIGEGGMGAVYKGHQKSVNRKVAVKTLRPALSETDEFVDRFFREAKIATRINHPNCVTILDFGQADGDGTLYLAMEYMEGAPLSDRMTQGDLTIEQIVKIGIQVSAALSAAHEVSIVHRDLKPDNIFLVDIAGGETHAKVLDFGIAKALDSKTQVTKTGMIFGTPEYMSPEQCRGTEIDGRSDLYSLGCILYELLGGRTPFSATTPMAILLAHVNDQVAELQSVSSGVVPAELNAIVMKLLSKDPDQRYPDAHAVKAVLESILGSLENPRATIDQPIVSGFEQTAFAAPAATDELIQAHRESSQQESIPAPKSNTGLYVALGVVGLLVATAFGAVLALNPNLLKGADEPTPVTSNPVEIAADETKEEEETVPTPEPTEMEEVVVAEKKETDEPPKEVVEVVDTNDEEKTEKEEKEVAVVKTKKKRTTKKETKKAPAEPKEKSKNAEVQEKVEAEKKEAKENVEKKVNKTVKKEVDKAGKALDKALDGLMGH